MSNAGLGADSELRKDRSFTTAPEMFRIYLDNFDALKRVSSKMSDAIEGKLSP